MGYFLVYPVSVWEEVQGKRMQIWPAIDLRGGKCVRLQQGDYSRETIFGDDPAATAKHWVSQGAECLHLVDLDGARSGQVANWPSIEGILHAVNVPCELGGGVRDETTIKRLLEAGMRRVVIGTLALKQPDWFRQMCRKYPDRLALGLDARGGVVATEGWRETSHTSALDLAQTFAGERLAAIIYTDIDTDGMLSGPNFDAIAQMNQSVDVPVVASGGVATGEDVSQLAKLGVAGCIIGRALYEGTVQLPDAMMRVRRAPSN